MLQTISLRDFVIVDQLELDFSSGFTVLTGETGAGKSILLDALGLAAGDRGQGRGSVRPGASMWRLISTSTGSRRCFAPHDSTTPTRCASSVRFSSPPVR